MRAIVWVSSGYSTPRLVRGISIFKDLPQLVLDRTFFPQTFAITSTYVCTSFVLEGHRFGFAIVGATLIGKLLPEMFSYDSPSFLIFIILSSSRYMFFLQIDFQGRCADLAVLFLAYYSS